MNLEDIPEENKNGDCYMNAANSILTSTGDARLVHGTVSGQGILQGIRFTHAWVEYGGIPPLVYDPSVIRNQSSCGTIQDKGLHICRDKYYDLGEIREEEVRRYTRQEAVEALLKYEHWGPWE